MLAQLAKATSETREFLDQYRFNDAATTLYRFLWGEFCDWGIELSKASKESITELGSIYKESLKLLHPFMPFISEYLYHALSKSTLEDSSSIMISSYPNLQISDEKSSKDFELIIEAIVSVRRCKTLIDQGNQKITKAYILASKDIDTNIAKPFIEKLAKVEDIIFTNQRLERYVSDVSDNLTSMIATNDIDLAPIINKLDKQKEKLQKEIDKLSSMLSNERFVANAPENVIEENKKALEEANNKLSKITSELVTLGASS